MSVSLVPSPGIVIAEHKLQKDQYTVYAARCFKYVLDLAVSP